MARDGLDRAAALARLAAQASRADRLAAADHVVANDGSRADLVREVDELWVVLQGAATAR
jgi:dephospho-CoA kinase